MVKLRAGRNSVLINSWIIHDQTLARNLKCWVGLDKICLAKFEQNGQPKERSNSASKMGCQFCQKSKMGKEWAFRLVLLVQPSSAAAERIFQFYSALQLSSSHLWRTTWNSLLCCNTTLLIRFSNFCLHFNYSMQKRNFLKAKWVKERAKWVNRKSKIGRFIEHKRKEK